MLRDLTIKNYRAFKDFSIDGLARVNLIVGDNNAGKTSFLEAVYLLTNWVNPYALLETLNNRGEYFNSTEQPGVKEFLIANIFCGSDPNKLVTEQNSIEIRSSESSLTLQVMGNTKFLLDVAVPPYVLHFNYEVRDEKAMHGTVELPLISSLVHISENRTALNRDIIRPQLFITARNIDFDYVGSLWNEIIEASQKEATVVEGLQILEPKIRDVRLMNRRAAAGVLIGIEDQPLRIPLSSMGDGLKWIFAMMAAATNANDGTLLIDEIDTGLHYQAQTDMWRLLLKVAMERNIQIFATTHSWDCVEAFQEALAEDDNADQGYLFRLQRRGDAIYPVGYTSADLDVAISHAIEVR